MLYKYTAHAHRGEHNTQNGDVVADTPKDAETKVKALYLYEVDVDLQYIKPGPIQERVLVMNRGKLV
jgi:hypothetical protein